MGIRMNENTGKINEQSKQTYDCSRAGIKGLRLSRSVGKTCLNWKIQKK